MATPFKSRFQNFVTHPYFVPVVILLVCIVITTQNYLLSKNGFFAGRYTFYNNYIIFKQSFIHLLENKNLYLLYPDEHHDYFKYSPTFSLFMAFFFWLPDFAGLLLWNLLNCFVFCYAIKNIRGITQQNQLFILAFAFLELIVSTMASQSNLLVAGLIISAFNQLEKEKPGAAAFLIVAGVFIKLFAILAALLFVFYNKKLRFIFYMALWTIVFLFAPLLITSPEQLLNQYRGWLVLLGEDRSVSTGISIYTIIYALLGSVNKNLTLFAGCILLLLPLLKIRSYSNSAFRAAYLSLILIWIIIFNHKGESPTYVIALAGCAIWGVVTNPSLPLKIVLFLTWLLSSFVKSDVFPKSVKVALHFDFTNALMPTVVFLVIVFALLWPVAAFRLKTYSINHIET